MSKHLTNNKGGALLIALSIMLMLTIGALVAVDTAQRDIDLSFNQLHYDQAFYVAEAGIREGIYRLNLDNAFNTVLDSVAFEGGTYWVVFVHSDIDDPINDQVLVRATATVQSACANIDAIVAPELLFPFVFAVFGDEFIYVDNSAQTGSYDSDVESNPTTLELTDGDVASNGTVTLDNATTVGGDASSALDPGVLVDATCTVTGDETNGVEPLELEPVEFPTTYDYANPTDGITGATYWEGDTLVIASNSTVTFAAGTYQIHNLLLSENSQIIVDPRVEIYMDGALLLSNNTSINPTQDPGDLLIFSTGSVSTLGNDVDIRAAFYGPDADVELNQSCDFFGSIISNSAALNNDATVYYDRALAQVPSKTTGKMFMTAWIER